MCTPIPKAKAKQIRGSAVVALAREPRSIQERKKEFERKNLTLHEEQFIQDDINRLMRLQEKKDKAGDRAVTPDKKAAASEAEAQSSAAAIPSGINAAASVGEAPALQPPVNVPSEGADERMAR